MNDYGTMCGSKKETYVFISLFTWTFTVLQTSVEARPAREVVSCVFFFFIFFFFKVLFHRGCCQNKSIASNLGWTAAYSIKGRAVWFRGTPPPSASWLWGDPAPQSPCPLACLQMGLQLWGWAVRPWRINQKALLARVFSSMLCLCVYPNVLEDYLCWLGLWICRSGWVMLEWFGWF